LHAVATSAVSRFLAHVPSGMASTRLLNHAETQRLADALASTNATAELLARSRVREMAERAEAANGLHKHGDDQPFEVFASTPVTPLPPLEAVAYFRGLAPKLGIDPERFGQLMQRHAFTLAAATDEIMLGKVKAIIEKALQTGEGGTWDVQEVLDHAGVTPRNPQYADMVFRTNMMDAYNHGVTSEMQSPDLQETFPVWKYLGIADGRQGADHEPHFDLYYPNEASFEDVRGERVYNCRCSPAPIDKWEWAELQAGGASVETDW